MGCGASSPSQQQQSRSKDQQQQQQQEERRKSSAKEGTAADPNPQGNGKEEPAVVPSYPNRPQTAVGPLGQDIPTEPLAAPPQAAPVTRALAKPNAALTEAPATDGDTFVDDVNSVLYSNAPDLAEPIADEDKEDFQFALEYAKAGQSFLDQAFAPQARIIGGDTPDMFVFRRASRFLPWEKRHLEIIAGPNAAGSDVRMGELQDHGLLSAVSALATFAPWRIPHWFPYDPSSANDNTVAGVGGTRVRLFSRKTCLWREIVVDGFVPCDLEKGQPAFAHNGGDEADQWVSLLEKAVAKMEGSYHALEAMTCGEALRILTGTAVWDVSERFTSSTSEGDVGALARDMGKWAKHSAVILECAADAKADALAPHGVGPRYGCLVLDVVRADAATLVKIRNVVGDASAWTGDWSQKSPLWDSNPGTLAECDNDRGEGGVGGTCWMTIEDAQKAFAHVWVCAWPAQGGFNPDVVTERRLRLPKPTGSNGQLPCCLEMWVAEQHVDVRVTVTVTTAAPGDLLISHFQPGPHEDFANGNETYSHVGVSTDCPFKSVRLNYGAAESDSGEMHIARGRTSVSYTKTLQWTECLRAHTFVFLAPSDTEATLTLQADVPMDHKDFKFSLVRLSPSEDMFAKPCAEVVAHYVKDKFDYKAGKPSFSECQWQILPPPGTLPLLSGHGTRWDRHS